MIPLKNVLLVNGTSSGITGIGLIAFANVVSNLFQVTPSSIVTGVGIFLLAFASLVIYEGLRSEIRVTQVKLIIALDACWVLASFITVALINLSMIGYASIIAVALWVAVMAYLQTKGLKQLTF